MMFLYRNKCYHVAGRDIIYVVYFWYYIENA